MSCTHTLMHKLHSLAGVAMVFADLVNRNEGNTPIAISAVVRTYHHVLKALSVSLQLVTLEPFTTCPPNTLQSSSLIDMCTCGLSSQPSVPVSETISNFPVASASSDIAHIIEQLEFALHSRRNRQSFRHDVFAQKQYKMHRCCKWQT